jgi:acetyl esterase/lipase
MRNHVDGCAMFCDARAVHQEIQTQPVIARLFIGFLLLLAVTGSAAEPIVLDLWPDKAPDEPIADAIGPERIRMSPGLNRTQVEVTNKTRLITGVTQPTITVYPAPAEKNTGAAMLICPGGGYWDLYWELEGEEVAQWLNSIGVTGIVLKYRVPRRAGEPEREPARRPLQDAQRAIRMVRSRAADWNIATNKIGIVGFSAGGHLAIASATRFGDKTYAAQDDVDRDSCRPDFAVSVYPGYLKDREKPEVSASISVPSNAPPVFLVHGDADLISPPEGSVLMYLALKRAGIPAEVHIYANTAHDFGVRELGRPCSNWTKDCAAWLKSIGVTEKR